MISSKVKSMFIFCISVVFVALTISGFQLFYLFMPMSFWTEYESVEPAKLEFKVGEPTKHISIAETFRKCNVKFNDVLFCKFNGEEEFDYYENYESGSFGKVPRGREKNDWTFHPAVPLTGECYNKSNIILRLPFGIERVQTLKGAVFKVTE